MGLVRFIDMYGRVIGEGDSSEYEAGHVETPLGTSTIRFIAENGEAQRDNEKRAEIARAAVLYEGSDPCAKDATVDLLSNILHLCDEEGYDFQMLLGTACNHYNAEKEAEVDEG